MAGSQKRIGKEYAELSTTPESGITVALTNESDLHDWTVTMTAPENSPYTGGTFALKLHLPENYPFKPPTLNFTTKIYHPNVSNDDKGTMCLGILRPDEWKPSSKIKDVLLFARHLLEVPNPDDAVEQSIAKEYKDDRKEFDKKAQDWVKRYAK